LISDKYFRGGIVLVIAGLPGQFLAQGIRDGW
jgi:hypothetical protein